MALAPFLGRSRNSSLWDPWEGSSSSSSLWDPWIPISRMWDAMDLGGMDSLTPAFSFSKDAQAVANTRVDWKETPAAHILTVDLPGPKREELKIELQDKSTLRISRERRREEVKESDQWHQLENGVLSVNVPKIKPDSAPAEDGGVKHIDIK
eukprot:Gb_06079 [translate_table: standard]